MKTEFKIFTTNWGFYAIEDLIKEYQKEHHLEVRNVVVLRRTEEGLVVGAIFEKSSEYKKPQNLKPDKYSYAYVEPGAH